MAVISRKIVMHEIWVMAKTGCETIDKISSCLSIMLVNVYKIKGLLSFSDFSFWLIVSPSA